MIWVDKYKPKKLSEVVGDRESLERLYSLIKKNKCVLVTGPTGSGKTCSVEAIAKEMDADLIEMNASDVRTKDAIDEKLLTAAQQQSLFMRPKILLVDEADGLTSAGVTAVKNIAEKSKFPVVVTANEAWELRPLKTVCESVEIRRPTTFQIRDFLKKIADSEGIEVDDSALKQLASLSGRDVRAAINDFEQVARGKKKLVMEDLGEIAYRDRETIIFDALKIIFKTMKPEHSLDAIDHVDLEPDMIMLWIEENIPREYEKIDDIARAYDAISRADVFAGRIRRRQNWTLMKYQIDNMTIGVSLAKKEMYRKFTRYMFPKYLSTMSKSKSIRTTKGYLRRKIGEKCHCSGKRAEGFIPLLKLIGKNIEWLEKEDLEMIRDL